jgi:hypothetical protein
LLSSLHSRSHTKAITGAQLWCIEGVHFMRRHEIHVLAFLSCLFVASIAVGLTAWF